MTNWTKQHLITVIHLAPKAPGNGHSCLSRTVPPPRFFVSWCVVTAVHRCAYLSSATVSLTKTLTTRSQAYAEHGKLPKQAKFGERMAGSTDLKPWFSFREV